MEVLDSSFVKGRGPKISAELWLKCQNGLGLILELARLIEDWNIGVKGVRENSGPRDGGLVTAQIGKLSEGIQKTTLAIGECIRLPALLRDGVAQDVNSLLSLI